MAGFDYEALEPDEDFTFSKRGRKKTPLNPKLVDALRQTFGSGVPAKLVMPNEQVSTFYNLLSKAGRELNYRINREVRKDTPHEGVSTYFFKAVALRDKDLGEA